MLLFLLSKRNPCSMLPFLTVNRFCSASAIQNSNPNFSPHNYLISSVGFSPDKAAKASKYLSNLKSPEKPDSVRSFLENQGFTKADIATFITRRPHILCCSPEKTLHPILNALRDIDLSSFALTKILLSCPGILQCRPSVPRIKFWRDFFGSDEAALIKALSCNMGLATLDIDKNIEPKMSLFQSHGLSTHQIQKIMLKFGRFMTKSVSSIEDVLNRTKEMGFQPESGMFMQGLQAMICIKRKSLKRKLELFEGFGWSEDDFFSAVRRAPRWAMLSEENLQSKMNFLIQEARCDPSYIASHPLLLAFSLEKRLRPRQDVLHLLELKGLSGKRKDYWNIMILTDIRFVERYILPNKEEISGLHEAYRSSCVRESITPFRKVELQNS